MQTILAQFMIKDNVLTVMLFMPTHCFAWIGIPTPYLAVSLISDYYSVL